MNEAAVVPQPSCAGTPWSAALVRTPWSSTPWQLETPWAWTVDPLAALDHTSPRPSAQGKRTAGLPLAQPSSPAMAAPANGPAGARSSFMLVFDPTTVCPRL